MRSQATGNLLIRELAPALAALGGEEARALPRRQPPLLPQPDDGGGQVRVAGAPTDCAGLERRLADVAQRHRRRHPARRACRAAGSPRRPRRSQDALLREGHAPEDAALDIGDSAVIECVGLGGMALARRAGRRRVLRRRRGGRGAAHRADGADLRRPLGALHDHAPRLRRHAGRHRRAARRRAGGHAADHHRRAARAARRRARSAPASPTSRSSRSAPRSPRSPRRWRRSLAVGAA